MSREAPVSAGGVRDVNNTCDVLHVARAAQFSVSDVLNQIVVAQQLLATGASLPADVNKAYGAQSGVTWLGEESSDVIAAAFAKDLDGGPGTFAVQLKLRTRYLDTILPGDILIAFMSDVGDYDPNRRFSGTFVTAAVVDRVGKTTAVDNMATVEVANVSSRDFTVVFSQSSTVFDQAFAQIENAMYTGDFIGRLFGNKKQQALSPLENVLLLLLLLYDADATGSKLASLQWKLNAAGGSPNQTQMVSVVDVTTFVQNPLPFYALAEPPGIIQAGNVWSLLDSYSNPLVNEMFVDVRDVTPQDRQSRARAAQAARDTFFPDNPADVAAQDAAVRAVLDSNLFRPATTQTGGGASTPALADGTSVVALVLRQRPYDDDAFNALPVTEVESTEVEEDDLARSSHDVFNWFRVRFPNLDVKLQELVAGIRIVPQSIAKFGFRRMEGETRYMFASSSASTTFSQGSTKTDFGDVFRQYVSLLSTWYGQNEVWLSGSLTMRFRPSIRVGTRLRLTRRSEVIDLYVQGVQHSFSKEPGGSRTTLTLTRGRVVSGATLPTVPVADFQHDGFDVGKGAQ